MDRLSRLARVVPALLLALLPALSLAALCGASGCGLFEHQDELGFRTYKLEGVQLAEAASIVHDVTREQANALFGGVTLTWDESEGNLELEPVYDGQRRLRLYIHLAASGADVNVEMFALVDHLEVSATQIGYGGSMQDIPLEEKLFKAYVTELSRRRDVGG